MPFKRKYRKKKRKVKKWKKKLNVTSGFRSQDPFPDQMRTKLVFCQRNQVNPAGLVSSYTYNLNSLYDPDVTGVGTQPMYYDQLCSSTGPYQRYRVYSCKYEIIISNLNTPARYSVCAYGNSPPADVDDATENAWGKGGIINSMTSGGGSIKKITGYVSLKKLLGESVEDDRDQALYNASPSNSARLAVQLESLDSATNMTSVNFTVRLMYFCSLFDKIPVAGS